MSLESHAINLKRTSDYPWRAHFSGNNLKSRIEGRINNLAGANFKRKFEERYMGETITFNNSEGEEFKLNLSAIKLVSNWGHYNLQLEIEGSRDNGWASYVWAKDQPYGHDPNFYLEDMCEKIPEGFSLTKGSSEKLSEMFSYQKLS